MLFANQYFLFSQVMQRQAWELMMTPWWLW
jgi:hypothetical protein